MEGLEKTEQRDHVIEEAKQIQKKMQILNQKEEQPVSYTHLCHSF